MPAAPITRVVPWVRTDVIPASASMVSAGACFDVRPQPVVGWGSCGPNNNRVAARANYFDVRLRPLRATVFAAL